MSKCCKKRCVRRVGLLKIIKLRGGVPSFAPRFSRAVLTSLLEAGVLPLLHLLECISERGFGVL